MARSINLAQITQAKVVNPSHLIPEPGFLDLRTYCEAQLRVPAATSITSPGTSFNFSGLQVSHLADENEMR